MITVIETETKTYHGCTSPDKPDTPFSVEIEEAVKWGVRLQPGEAHYLCAFEPDAFGDFSVYVDVSKFQEPHTHLLDKVKVNQRDQGRISSRRRPPLRLDQICPHEWREEFEGLASLNKSPDSLLSDRELTVIFLRYEGYSRVIMREYAKLVLEEIIVHG